MNWLLISVLAAGITSASDSWVLPSTRGDLQNGSHVPTEQMRIRLGIYQSNNGAVYYSQELGSLEVRIDGKGQFVIPKFQLPPKSANSYFVHVDIGDGESLGYLGVDFGFPPFPGFFLHDSEPLEFRIEKYKRFFSHIELRKFSGFKLEFVVPGGRTLGAYVKDVMNRLGDFDPEEFAWNLCTSRSGWSYWPESKYEEGKHLRSGPYHLFYFKAYEDHRCYDYEENRLRDKFCLSTSENQKYLDQKSISLSFTQHLTGFPFRYSLLTKNYYNTPPEITFGAILNLNVIHRKTKIRHAYADILYSRVDEKTNLCLPVRKQASSTDALNQKAKLKLIPIDKIFSDKCFAHFFVSK